MNATRINNARNYYNAAKDVSVAFKTDDSFVIMGDDAQVTDAELEALYAGETVDGWEVL